MGVLDWFRGLFRKKDADAWAADARERLAKNKIHRALVAAERAVEQRPDDPDLLTLRSEILQRSDLRDRALDDLLAALEREPGRAAALLERIEALEQGAAAPERVWSHTWRVYAERGDYREARQRVARIAARGDGAGRDLQAQCAAMLSGTGDRRAALFGLAFLAHERGSDEEAVSRVLEATGGGGRSDLAFADLFLQELLTDRNQFASALRALVVVRVLLGNEDEARDLVVSLCRNDADAGVALLEELRAGERRVASFSLGLLVDMEKAGEIPVRLSELLARGLMEERREEEAARVVLRAVRRERSAGETLLPMATRLMKSQGGLDALEAHARCAAAVGDVASVFLTVHEFVEKDATRAQDVLEMLPAADTSSGEGALLMSRVRAGMGDHQRAALDLRKWALGGGGVGASAAVSHVRAVAQTHPQVSAYGVLLADLLQATGDIEAAGMVLLDLVRRHPSSAGAVSTRALSVVQESSGPVVFAARLAAARAGLVRSDQPGRVLAHLRSAQKDAPARENDILHELEDAASWVADCEPVELYRAELILRSGRVDDGLKLVEDVVVRNPARGGDAQAVLRAVAGESGAGDSRVLFAEHRVRLLLRDYEGCVGPLRRVADLDEPRRDEVLEAVDSVIAESPSCRSAHRAGVEIALRLGHDQDEVFGRLSALLDIPTPPRDTAYVTRRALGVQGTSPVLAGHRLLARCHLFAQRLPLCVEEARRMTECDATTRGEAIRFLEHVLDHDSGHHEARFLMASLQAALGAADPAREALRGALPRTDRVFAAWSALAEAFPSHLGVRLDIIDARVEERHVDAALEEIARILNVGHAPIEELVARLETILRIAPEYGPALYSLADVHHAARDWKAEIQAYGRILYLAPHEAEQVLSRLDVILAEDPTCLDAALEIVSRVRLHQRIDRVGPEARRALDIASTKAEIERVASTLEELERDLLNDVPFLAVLADAFARAGRLRAAVGAYRTLLKRDRSRAAVVVEGVRPISEGTGEEAISALEVLFEGLLAVGDPSGACRAASDLLERRPEDVVAARSRFDRVLKAHDESHEAAQGALRTAVLEEDADGAVTALLHDLRWHPDLRREVGRQLEELAQRFPGASEVPLARAEYILLPLNLLGDAADALETALDLDPNCNARVLRLADLILERDSLLPRGHRTRGKALTAAADAGAAVQSFVRMAELHPDRMTDALEGLEAVLRDAPGHVEARYRRGRALLALGRAEAAAEQAQALAETLRPGEEDEYRALVLGAEALEAMGQWEESLAMLRLAAERHEGHPEILALIRANGRRALEARAKELRNAPDEERPDADLDLAATLLAAGGAEASLAAVGPMPAKGRALARWKVLRGRAFRGLGRGASALAELEDALRVRGIAEGKSSIGVEALFEAGRAYIDTGERVKAIRRLEQVAGADPQYGRVREILDRLYDEDRRELDRPLEVTVTLESVPEVRGE